MLRRIAVFGLALGAVVVAGSAFAQSIPTIRVGWTIPAEEAKYWMMKRPDKFPNLGKTYKIEWSQFNGTARIMAVGWTKTGVGSASKDVVIRDPVVVTASLPKDEDLWLGFVEGNAAGQIQTLTGTNTYTGTTTVVAGVLEVTGSLASQVTASNSGTKVTGGGTFGGGLIMGAGTTHAPGASPGAPIVTGTLEYNASTLVVDIWTNLNGVDATPGTHFDQITINGATPTLTLLNAPNIVVDLNNLYNPALGNSYVIITGFNNTVTSGFNSTVTVNNGASFVSAGKSFQIDYNTGNIALTVIPEPATFGLLLAFGAAAVIRRRRIG